MRKRLYEIIEKANPNDRISKYYDGFMLFVIVLSIVPLFFKNTNLLFNAIDAITVIIFIVDYLLRWLTADIANNKPNVWCFVKYPFTFYAIIDLLSILPSLTILSSGFKLFKLFRINKAFKTFKLLRYSKSFELIIVTIKKQKRPLLAVCYLAFGYVIVSALIMFSVEPNSFNNFFDAFYWAVVTLTTVGYGDIYPTSDIGKIVGMVSSFMGIAIVALPTGIITAGYMDELNSHK